MKANILTLTITAACCFFHFTSAQSLKPSVIPSSGGYFSAGGKSLSWTLGEPFYKTLQNGNTILTQGFQQPYISLKILNLKAFIEGLYLGGGLMQPLLFNNNSSVDPTACDSITVELRAAASPFALMASVNAILHTNGNATVTFPSSLINASYYIILHHRNSLETWSKDPVLFSTQAVSFDFTSP